MQKYLEVSKIAQPGLALHGSALPGPALKLHTSLNKNTKQIPESIKKKVSKITQQYSQVPECTQRT